MREDKRKVVSVFRTSVEGKTAATVILNTLLASLPGHRINFDLEDSDKILRIEGAKINCAKIIAILNTHNYECDLLEVVE